MIRVAVIGLGLIGRERVKSIEALRRHGYPVAVAATPDADATKMRDAARISDAPGVDSIAAVVGLEPDWYIVATPHDDAAAIAAELLATGSKVLVEKPLGRSGLEAEALVKTAASDQLWVGLNYRFFEGVSALIRDVRAGTFGVPISATAVVGHGGAPGMETSWKLNATRAGGGALIDPGIHLLDLAMVLAGEPLNLPGWVKLEWLLEDRSRRGVSHCPGRSEYACNKYPNFNRALAQHVSRRVPWGGRLWNRRGPRAQLWAADLPSWPALGLAVGEIAGRLRGMGARVHRR